VQVRPGLPSLSHPRRVNRIPPVLPEHPADRQRIVPILQADHAPLQALCSGQPLLHPQDHHLTVQVLGLPTRDFG